MISFNRILSVISAAALSVSALVSCGDGEPAETMSEPSNETEAVYCATPSEGVGREFPPEETEPYVEPMPQIICIDPGHGFDDGGTSSEYLNGLNEDDITLAVSLMLDEELKKLGYQTVLTHNGEEFPVTSAYDYNNKYKPQERTAFANSVDIDYYVSIHCNSHTNPEAEGTRIYTWDGYGKREQTSYEIACSINNGLLQHLEPGSISSVIDMTENVFHVLRYTVVPASLLEIGFVTNESDAAKMLDENWQRAFAKGVAKGIDDYYRSGSTSAFE